MAEEIDGLHCIVLWDVYAKDPERNRQVRAQLEAALKGTGWVRPVSASPFFIVPVRDAVARRRIKDKLVEICKENPGTARVIVGPPVVGSYGGWLAKDMWPKVRKRTDPDSDA